MVSAASVMVSAARLAVSASAGNGDVSIDQVVPSGIESSQWLHAGLIVAVVLALTIVVARVLRRVLQRAMATGFAPLMISRLGASAVFLVGFSYALGTLALSVAAAALGVWAVSR